MRPDAIGYPAEVIWVPGNDLPNAPYRTLVYPIDLSAFRFSNAVPPPPAVP